MPTYSDFLDGRDHDLSWFAGDGGKVENTIEPPHKHYCAGCMAFWGHEDPCDYGGENADWECPICIEKGAPE